MNSNSIFGIDSIMLLLYNISMAGLGLLYRIASWFNPKARDFVTGRKQQSKILSGNPSLSGSEKLVWIHCASLGEFEQGRPVIEALKTLYPSIKILLTFFSPSGFNVRKNYEYADFVYYLPMDTARKARKFVNQVSPALVIFVKYEFWYHYAREIKSRNIPLLSISSIFREDQIFFRMYGSMFRSILKCFSHFFVQNNHSKELLMSIGVNEVTLTGDTRFDRVYQLTQQTEELKAIKEFKDGQKLMVIGSAWPEDMEVLFPFINENKDRLKFIIAPHEISESFLDEIEKSISSKCIRYSKIENQSVRAYPVMIIDHIGMLGRLYRYGEFAYVGGGFKQGLHNILEPACFGVPIFFGNKAFQKFQEAVDLVMRGGAFEVGNYTDLKTAYALLNNHPESFLLACDVTRQYVTENLGATDEIVNYCKKILS